MCHGLRVWPSFLLGYRVSPSKNLILKVFKVIQPMRPKHQPRMLKTMHRESVKTKILQSNIDEKTDDLCSEGQFQVLVFCFRLFGFL